MRDFNALIELVNEKSLSELVTDFVVIDPDRPSSSNQILFKSSKRNQWWQEHPTLTKINAAILSDNSLSNEHKQALIELMRVAYETVTK